MIVESSKSDRARGHQAPVFYSLRECAVFQPFRVQLTFSKR
jgi:hypothetical protein